MDKLIELLGGIVIIGGLVLIVYFIARYYFLTHRMLAEKGMLRESRIRKRDVAFTGIGLGIGLLVSAGLSQLEIREDTLDLLTWGIILIFGAVGLLLAAQQKK